MVRSLVLLIVGAIIGSGAVFVLSDTDDTATGNGAAPVQAITANPADNVRPQEFAAANESAASRLADEADQLAVLAAADPEEAIALAVAKPGDSLKRMFLIRAGEGAARLDPVAALARAAEFSDRELRSGFALGVLNAWAELDPAGLLEFLETADPDEIGAPVPWARLVIGDPVAVLDRLDNYDGIIREALEREALLALAETDAPGTLARLDAMAAGPQKSRLLLAVAETYGREAPEAALNWVLTLNPPTQEMLNGVIDGMASADVNRAIDWVLQATRSPPVDGLNPAQALPITQIMLGVRNGKLPMPAAAERLLASGDSTLRDRGTSALLLWAPENAAEAVSFVESRLDQFEPGSMTTLAMQLAESSPDIVLQTGDRLPPEYRENWVAGVADALVRTRPQRALDYLASQRGQPGYGQGVVAAVRQLAPADPETAAALVSNSDASPQISNAARIVATAWSDQDAASARQWVFSLAAGEARDAGITGLLGTMSNAGEVDTSLLDAFTSNASRQQAAATVIRRIGRTDQARASALIDSYISDAGMQQQLQQQLEQIARAGAVGMNMGQLPSFNLDQMVPQ